MLRGRGADLFHQPPARPTSLARHSLSTTQPDTAARAVAAAAPLATLADHMVTSGEDPEDSLACLRVRSGRCELMIATGEEEAMR